MRCVRSRTLKKNHLKYICAFHFLQKAALPFFPIHITRSSLTISTSREKRQGTYNSCIKNVGVHSWPELEHVGEGKANHDFSALLAFCCPTSHLGWGKNADINQALLFIFIHSLPFSLELLVDYKYSLSEWFTIRMIVLLGIFDVRITCC